MTAGAPVPAPEGIVWHPSPNFTAGRGGAAAIAIVHHIMLGTLAGTDDEFARAAAQVSAHFGLGADGTIHQYVHEGDTAWANGNVRAPNLAAVPWIKPRCQDADPPVNPNRLTISIEWEGTHHGMNWIYVPWDGEQVATLAHAPPLLAWRPPEVQYQRGLALTRWLAAAWAISRDRAHICRHADFDTITRWFCPGAGFPMTRLLSDLAGAAP